MQNKKLYKYVGKGYPNRYNTLVRLLLIRKSNGVDVCLCEDDSGDVFYVVRTDLEEL